MRAADTVPPSIRSVVLRSLGAGLLGLGLGGAGARADAAAATGAAAVIVVVAASGHEQTNRQRGAEKRE